MAIRLMALTDGSVEIEIDRPGGRVETVRGEGEITVEADTDVHFMWTSAKNYPEATGSVTVGEDAILPGYVVRRDGDGVVRATEEPVLAS